MTVRAQITLEMIRSKASRPAPGSVCHPVGLIQRENKQFLGRGRKERSGRHPGRVGDGVGEERYPRGREVGGREEHQEKPEERVVAAAARI